VEEKGMVMEIHGPEVIVLTPGGEFKRVKPKTKPVIGEEVEFSTPKQPSVLRCFAFIAAAAVMLALVLVPNLFAPAPVAMAYMTIDINPSIELTIDGDKKVMAAEALNVDGATLLTNLALVGKTASEAATAIIDAAIAQGYLPPAGSETNADHGAAQGTIIVAVTPASAATKKEFTAALEVTVKEVVVKEIVKVKKTNAVVETIAAGAELRRAAKQNGLSVGKYAILLEAQKAGLAITAEQLQRQSVAQAIKAAGGNVGEIIGKAHGEKDFKKLQSELKVKVKEKKGQEKQQANNGRQNKKEDNKNNKYNKYYKEKDNKKAQQAKTYGRHQDQSYKKTGDRRDNNDKRNNNAKDDDHDAKKYKEYKNDRKDQRARGKGRD